jgi:hypothetical protein
MSNTVIAAGALPAPRNLFARAIGVLTAPQATFEAIVAHPKWFDMLALVVLTSTILVGGFMFTKVGQEAWLDAATNSPWSGDISDEQYARMERMAQYAGYFAIGQMLVVVPILYLAVAAILFAVFNAAMGGSARFKQVFAVVVHSAPIMLLGQMFTVPLNYARGSMSSATNLSVLLPMIDTDSFLGSLLATIDVFLVWYVVVLAIGLGVLYRRRTRSIAIGLFAVYAVIALTIAVVKTNLGS